MTTIAGTTPDLRRLLAGQVTSVFGGTLTATATSVIAVVVLHARPVEVALIVGAGLVSTLLFGPVIGVLLDRVTRPRRALIAADLVAAGAVGGTAITGLTGTMDVTVLAALNLVLGTVRIVMEGLYFPHLHGLGVSDIGTARARLQAGELFSRSAAGSVAGPLAAALAVPLLFLLDALTYLFSAGALLSLRSPDRRVGSPARKAGFRREFADGLLVLRGHPVLAGFVVYLLIGGVASSGVLAQRAIFLLDDLGLPVALFTVPTVAATLLGAGGALLAPRLVSRGVAPRRLVLAGLPAAAVTTAALPAAGGPVTWILVATAFGIAAPAFFGALANIGLITMLGADIGDEFFGRVATLLATTSTFAGTLGALAGGVLAESFGTRGGIWICVALDGFAALVLLWVSRRSDRPAGGERKRATPGAHPS